MVLYLYKNRRLVDDGKCRRRLNDALPPGLRAVSATWVRTGGAVTRTVGDEETTVGTEVYEFP